MILGRESHRVQVSEAERLLVHATDTSNLGVTGATVTGVICRESDGFFWSGMGFSASPTSLAFTETDSSNLPGVYHYDFRPLSTDTRFVVHAESSTVTVVNGPWVSELIVGFWVDSVDADLSDLLEGILNIKAKIGVSYLDEEFSKLRSMMK